MIDPVAYWGQVQPNKLAIGDFASGLKLTYGEFDRRIDRCAALLEQTLGEPIGERVAVLSRNSLDFLAIHFACIRIGAIFVPLNWRLAAAEISVLVQDSSPRLLFVEREFQPVADAMTGGHTIDRIWPLEPEPFQALIDAAPATPSRPRPDRSNQPSTLLYTSGTTGRPKGVMFSERNAFASNINFALSTRLGASSVMMCDMPLFHVAGLMAGARAPLLMGATLLLSPRFDPELALQRLSDRALGITHTFYVTQMTQTLREHPAYAKADLSRLVCLVTGGAPNPAANVQRWLDDGVIMADGFGMSETGSAFNMPLDDPERIRRKVGSSGLPLVTLKYRLVKPDGADAAPGEVGELRLKGPSVTIGYWNNPEATAAAFDEQGYLKSGDLAYADEDGFLFIVDRLKDMFISGGENVYPTEIEAVIAELDVVSEAAVIAVPDPQWGEAGLAYVVPVPGAQITPEAIIEHVRSRLARYKAPKRVIITEHLPRTASGKLQKTVLRERALEQLEAERAG
ncbi:MAG TPA: AMP-binding protein [Caulobacteraceae bacterium]